MCYTAYDTYDAIIMISFYFPLFLFDSMSHTEKIIHNFSEALALAEA